MTDSQIVQDAQSTQTDPTPRRWPTGWLILAGLLIGALVAVLAGASLWQVPLATAVGLALGVGIDSLLHYWLND